MKACPNCGEENPERARFCLNCGTALDARAAPRGREERKVVSVLFCDLVGFTSRAERLDPEDVRALLQPYHARLRSELERFGGTVEKFIGDAVVALFGAPVAHEDDPERAVRAALAIRDGLADEVDLHLRIGITTGEALVALDARSAEGEGMASGDVVNTAARLQAAAPTDGILVDEGTYRATERVIVYRASEPVLAKGKLGPLVAWEAVEARSRVGVERVHRRGVPLVGRQRELAVLVDALARARADRAPQLVTLVGVPGIGKSRLVWELFQVVEQDPELVFWRHGRSLPYGEGVTFWALGEMVKAQAGILETDPADTVEAKLRGAVAETVPAEAEVGWVEGHLRPLVGLAPEREAGEERHAEAFAAWRLFFEGLAERSPLVLVFEDLHWADAGLLDFVDHLATWARDVPLLVVCTARPELLARRAGWGGGKPNAVTLSLAPLSDEDTARLLAALLDRPLVSAETQAPLLARAGGNPLYAEEYARMLTERGGEELVLPETVQGIIAARLDSLASEEKQLLQDAAVVGKVFWLGALTAIGGRERWTVEELLHGLERREFVRRERRSSVATETEYAFGHTLVRDVAYGQIPRAVRADKHLRSAEWIESLGRPEDQAEMLAHHYLAALELARTAGESTDALAGGARGAFREAGDRALALEAYGGAARFYQAALDLWPEDDPARPSLLFRHAKAVWNVGSGGLEELDAAREALLTAGDRETAAEAEALMGVSFWRNLQRDEAFEHLDRAAELVADAPASPSKVAVLAGLARLLMLAEETERALPLAREALAMADSLGLEGRRAEVLNSLGIARLQAGDLDGLNDLEDSLALAQEMNSPEVVRSHINLASAMVDLGDLERAFQLHAEGRRHAERFGADYGVRWLEAEQTFDFWYAGRWEEALSLAGQFIAAVEGGLSHQMAAACYVVRALIRCARSDPAGADADSARALQLARAVKDPQNLYPVLASRARMLMSLGRRDESEHLANELLALWAERPFNPNFWVVDLAVCLGELGRRGPLLPAPPALTTPWLEGAEHLLAGEFAPAADVLARIGSLPDEAYARLCAAESLAAAERWEEANAELPRSLDFYRSVGATAYLSRAQKLEASRSAPARRRARSGPG
jgi:class 3 adenylate cyclase/tetratricopeptide (TPR) repeat protein